MNPADEQVSPELLKKFLRTVTETYDALAKMGFGDRGGLDELGALGMAHQHLKGVTTPQSFSQLWEMGRLQLSIEAIVLRPEFKSLFSDQERQIARDRLSQKGYREAD